MACPGAFGLYVSSVEKAGPCLRVWGQRDVKAAEAVERQLLQCTQEFETGAGMCDPAAVRPDDLCCARFSDGSYYRARVVDVDPLTGTAGCLFIDYGNRDRVPLTDLRLPPSVPAMFRTPAQASSFILTGVVGTWDAPVLKLIMDEIGYESLSGLVAGAVGAAGQGGGPIPLLKIYYKGRDYAEVLQAKGAATVVPQHNFEFLVWNTLVAVAPPGPPAAATPLQAAPPAAPQIPQMTPPMAMPPAYLNYMWQSMMGAQGMPPGSFPMNMPSAVVPPMPPSVPVPARTLTDCVTMGAMPGLSPNAVPAATPVDLRQRAPLTRFEPVRLKNGTDHKVYVSHVQKGSYTFAAQLAANDAELEAMVAKLNSPTMTLERLVHPFPGTICLAKYSEDDSIYRGVITNVDSGDSVLVYFVDYGNTDAVKCRDLFEIPAEFTFPKVMAVQFSLARLDSSQATAEMFDLFYQLALEKDGVVQVVPPKCEDLMTKQFAELYIDNTNIDQLINNQLAKRRPAPKVEFRNVELPQAGSKVKVIVAYVKSVGNFFVQLAAKKSELDSVMSLVNQHCSGPAKALTESEVRPGAACCALFSADDRWYRSMIINAKDLTVMYVDYGNEEKVSLSDLRSAEEHLIATRAQAIPCRLAGVEGEDNDELSARFEEIALEETVMMHVLQLNMDLPQLVVRLVDKDGNDIGEMLKPASSSSVTGSGVGEVSSRAAAEPIVQVNGYGQGSRAGEDRNSSYARSSTSSDRRESGGRESSGPKGAAGFGEGNRRRDAPVQSNGWGSSADSKDTGFSDRNGFRKDFDKSGRGGSDEPHVSDRRGGRGSDSGSKWREDGDRSNHAGSRRGDRNGGPQDSEAPQDHGSSADRAAWGIGERSGGDVGHCDRMEAGTVYDREQPREGTSCGSYGRQDGSGKRFQRDSAPATKSSVAAEEWGDSHTAAPSMEKLSMDINSKKPVEMVFANGPNDFYLHVRPSDPSFEQLVDKIAEVYNNGGDPLPTSSVTVGTICIAKYSEDDAYYRARVTSVSGSSVGVVFVDYGNGDTVDCSELRAIKPSMLESKAQAIHCRLMGIPEHGLTGDQVLQFNSLCESMSLEAEFVELKDDTYSVILKDLSDNSVINVTYGASPESLVCPTSIVTTLQADHFAEGTSFDITVSWFETPGRFYIQRKSSDNEFNKVMTKLQLDYKQSKPLASPSMGQAVVAKFKEDNAFYRGVVKVQKGDKYGVQYVDYGNRSLVDAVYGLQHQHSTVPVHAMLCALDGVLPVDSSEWRKKDPELCRRFEGDFVCTVIRSTSDADIPCVVSLTRSGQDLAQDLISRRLAAGSDVPESPGDVEDVPAQELISQQPASGSDVLDVPEKVEGALETPGVDLDMLVGQTIPAYVVGVDELVTYICLDPMARARVQEDLLLCSRQELVHLPPEDVVLGKACLVLTLNAEYRRGIVTDSTSTAGLSVKYMDHAGWDEIPCDNIYAIPETFAKIPALVHEATLTNVQSPADLKTLLLQNVVLSVEACHEDRIAGQLMNGLGQRFPFVERTFEGLLPLPVLKQRLMVDVVHASGTTVWLQPVSQADVISKLLDDMFNSHEEGGQPLASFQPGTLCAAKSVLDENWYRAMIEEEASGDVTVTYLDYGNGEVVPAGNIKKLAEDFLCMHAQAVSASLPITSDAAIGGTILEMTADKTWTAVFVKRGDEWLVELLDGAEQLSLAVVRTGKAFSMEGSPFPAIFAEPEVDLSVGSCLPAVVSFIKSAVEFYVHLESDSEALEKMQGDLQAVSHCMNSLKAYPEVGSKIMALYSEDSVWYRGEVLPGQKILFIDYGNDEAVELDNLKSLPPVMQASRPLAVKCSLVAPVNKTWSEGVMDSLEEVLESGSLMVEVKSIQDNTFIVDVATSSVPSLTGFLAERGFLKGETDGGDCKSVLVTSVTSPSDFWVCLKDPGHSLMHCGFYLPSYHNDWSAAAVSKFKELAADSATLFHMVTLLPGDPIIVSLSLDGKKVDEQLRDLCSPWEPSGASLKATVVFSNSPSDFYIHLARDDEAVAEMASNMEKAEQFGVCEETGHGALCTALFPEDGVWYRARILSHEGDQFTVSFIDFGNEAVTSDIRALPQHLQQIPPLALRCSLPTPQEVSGWQECAAVKFEELISSDAEFEVELLSSTEPFLANLNCAGCNVAHQIASVSGIDSVVIDEEIKALRSSLVSPTSSRGIIQARMLTLDDIGNVQPPPTVVCGDVPTIASTQVSSCEDPSDRHSDMSCPRLIDMATFEISTTVEHDEEFVLVSKFEKTILETIMEADSSSDVVQEYQCPASGSVPASDVDDDPAEKPVVETSVDDDLVVADVLEDSVVETSVDDFVGVANVLEDSVVETSLDKDVVVADALEDSIVVLGSIEQDISVITIDDSIVEGDCDTVECCGIVDSLCVVPDSADPQVAVDDAVTPDLTSGEDVKCELSMAPRSCCDDLSGNAFSLSAVSSTCGSDGVRTVRGSDVVSVKSEEEEAGCSETHDSDEIGLAVEQGDLEAPVVSDTACSFADDSNVVGVCMSACMSDVVEIENGDCLGVLSGNDTPVGNDAEMVVAFLSYPDVKSLESNIDGVSRGSFSAKASEFERDLKFCVPGTMVYSFEDCEDHSFSVEVKTSTSDDCTVLL